jgi:thiopurine S-methyltransferase
MDPSHWLNRWQTHNITGFHLSAPNPSLVQYWPTLSLTKGSRVLVPLCGKTLDLPWLASQGHKVVGAELSELAVDEFFRELGVTPKVSQHGPLQRLETPGVEIFQGDFFDLTPELLGPIDAIYDRAALVALPPAMRDRYVPHLLALSHAAPQLLLTYAYDESRMDGPPFCIRAEEVQRRYSGHYKLVQLLEADVEGGLRGKTPALETIWRLERR